MALFLQRVLRRARAQHADGIGVHLQRLLGPRRKHHAACHHKAGAHARFGNVLVIFQLGGFKHHLQRLEAGAVGKLDKSRCFWNPAPFWPSRTR